MPILNRSDVEVRATIEAEDGWTVDPSEMVLQPGERTSATVTGSGEDGALVTVRMAATATPAPGEQASELALSARVYAERPPEPRPWLLYAVVAVVGIATGLGIYRRRFAR